MPFDWRHKLRSLAQVGESLQTLASLAVDLREQLRGHQIQLDALYSHVALRIPHRYATVMLFWHSFDEQPHFASTTLLVDGSNVLSETMRLQSHVPAGAWLVAVGAHLASVMVGNELMDSNMPERSPMLKLRLAVPVGMQLRFSIVPTSA